MSGNRDDPAIPDFEPGLPSDVLYVTNGETTDFAHAQQARWPGRRSSARAATDGGFVFPDDEAQVQAEFERALPFALDVAKSAADPANPVSHLGLETKPFYLQSDDTYKDGLPGVELHVRLLLRRPAGGARHRQAQPGRRDAEVLHQRRPRDRRADRGVDRR